MENKFNYNKIKNCNEVVRFCCGSYGELKKAVYESYDEYKEKKKLEQIDKYPDLFAEYILRRFPKYDELNSSEKGMIRGYIKSITKKKENSDLNKAIDLASIEAEELLSADEQRSGLDREDIREL